MKVTIPDNNIEERKYIINELLGRILGIDIEFEIDKTNSDYLIRTSKKTIIIKDYFFSLYPITKSYISQKAIPNSIVDATCSELDEIPIIFGKDEYKETTATIICDVDIFASAFFMLTRWEEFLLGREASGKCSEKELLCVKCGYIKRAIVNEYICWLGKVLSSNGVVISKNSFLNIKITHDVDRCYLTGVSELAINLFRLAFRKKQSKKACRIFIDYIKYRVRGCNPMDSFDEIVSYSNKYNIKNAFYFKACQKGELGYTYSFEEPRIQRIVERLFKNKFEIGFHPSENTFLNEEQFKKEYNRIADVIGKKSLQGGRSHGLYYSSLMMSFWNKYLKYDSGMGYQFHNGFRCGICYPFRWFDIATRTTFNLQEIPFVAMDTVALRLRLTPEEAFLDVKETIDVVKKFNGTICINWHSNLLNDLSRKKFKKVYFGIVDYAAHLLY